MATEWEKPEGVLPRTWNSVRYFIFNLSGILVEKFYNLKVGNSYNLNLLQGSYFYKLLSEDQSESSIGKLLIIR